MPVHVTRLGDALLVEMDNPPVNAINAETRRGLMAAVAQVQSENGLRRVILCGRNGNFAAGADAREFDATPMEPHLPDVVMAIENCAVPWIAAIEGAALGGGLELAMACRYRIAAEKSQLGLPEVTLGLVPGAGGTQLLPHLVGEAKAALLAATGRPQSSAEAVKLGLVDAIAADPVAAAKALDPATLAASQRTSTRHIEPATNDEIKSIAADLARKQCGQEAPPLALSLVQLARQMPIAEAMREERAAFIRLRSSPQAKAMRHIFFAERGAKPPKEIAAVAPPDLKQVAVVGGGTMGAGIAWALASAGLAVVLLETDSAAIERAKANVQRIAGQTLAAKLASADEIAQRLGRVAFSADYGHAAKCSLAIEAAFEDMDVKKKIFTNLEKALVPDAILASNTSYLDINVLADAIVDPTRVVGLHFFAPAHVMKLLEIVRGAKTSNRALATAYAVAKRLKKTPVLAGVCDGFIGNRILARYREAADTILMDGSTPWEIDEAMVGFGYAMGLYETQDLSGLDIAFAARRRQDATRDPRRRYIPIADRMVREGRLGRKVGVGWYRYPGGGGKVIDPLIEDLVREEAYFAKVTRREYTPDEIRDTLLLAMINEACHILGEGIAASATDIDLVSVLGYGFPRYRGGLMHYADTLGPANLLRQVQAKADTDPVAWAPAPLLVKAAASGQSLGGSHL